MKRHIMIALICVMFFLLSGCDGLPNKVDVDDEFYPYYIDNESYLDINESPFINVSEKAESSFSMDTSTAGYANLRRMIKLNQQIPANSIKIEEMVNYFRYNYPSPTGEDTFSVSSEIMICPWNNSHKLMTVGLKAKDIQFEEKANNVVFLIDVSGSMADWNKLTLLKESFKIFVDTLKEDDVISIVTYSNQIKVILDGVSGYQKPLINEAIEQLSASGSTNGAGGIQEAYLLAEKNFIVNGNNRVILGTDGDFNVGISSTQELANYISEKRNTNIYLSILGYGMGNLKDDKLETLANKGNGNYAYIDNLLEAKKVLVNEIGGTMNVVAKDTKAQVTFNPKYVKSYRLIGYENKRLNDDEFNNEYTDAGEIGSGHMTTAVFEFVTNDQPEIESTMNDAWYKVNIRHIDPATSENKEIISFFDVNSELTSPSEDILFISGIVETGLILRNSQYKGESSYANVVSRIKDLSCIDTDSYKKEFYELVNNYLLER